MKAHDLNENIHPIGLAAASIVAAGAGDNVEITAAALDTDGFESLTLLIPFTTALGNAESLAFTVRVGESADNSAFDADATLANAVVVASSVGGDTIVSCYKLKVNLSGVGAARKRYLRFKVTPNLSRAGTDTASFGVVAVLGGPVVAPVAAYAAASA